jgi:GT2 family glycosyltransferase
MSVTNLLDIIIVNWNADQQLKTCLDSLTSNLPGGAASINVVDNSEKGNSGDVELENSQVHFIYPEKNLGFGGGCNLGAAQGHSPFILFLNPDIIFPDSSLEKLLTKLETADFPDQAGIIGVQLLNFDGSIQKNIARFPRFKHLFPRMFGLDRLFPKTFKPHYRKDLDYSQNQVVEQAPGAFFLVRRKVFEQLGGFDERFFMYYEDVDFSYRAHLAGWQTLYLAVIAVYHQGGGTTQSIQGKRLFYSLRSKVIYVAKHFGRPKACLVIIGVLLLEFPVRIILSLFRFSFGDIKNTIYALGLFFVNIPNMVKMI